MARVALSGFLQVWRHRAWLDRTMKTAFTTRLFVPMSVDLRWFSIRLTKKLVIERKVMTETVTQIDSPFRGEAIFIQPDRTLPRFIFELLRKWDERILIYNFNFVDFYWDKNIKFVVYISFLIIYFNIWC